MIEFVNAKINLGLNVVGKREDGYHLLETLFYPIGVYNGRPENQEPFNDMLEVVRISRVPVEGREQCEETDSCSDSNEITEEGIVDAEFPEISYYFSGKKVDCSIDKHLVVKAAREILKEFDSRTGKENAFFGHVGGLKIYLHKQLPDGAGMGGGSADASFTLRMLNSIGKQAGLVGFNDSELENIALRLGADCPVFIRNRPAYAEGIGEKLEEVGEVLAGKWALVVKPSLSISTKEAFAGITPQIPYNSIKEVIQLPLSEWKGKLKNDFEDSLFPKYPILSELKDALYSAGAVYASMTGSGAALYGIFETECSAREAHDSISVDYKAICKL